MPNGMDILKYYGVPATAIPARTVVSEAEQTARAYQAALRAPAPTTTTIVDPRAPRPTYPGQALVEARSAEWLSRQPGQGPILPVTPIVMGPPAALVPIPTPIISRPVAPVPYTPRPVPMPPTIVAGPGVPVEPAAPSPVTSSQTTAQVVDLDLIHQLLIILIVINFLQVFGGIMAGAAGGAAAGWLKG
ncbi:hypothetical protein ES705_35429 [subsurface metagenome]